MKVARVKHAIVDGKLTFEVISVRDIPFSQIPGIDETLKQMNLSRYFIRRAGRAHPPSALKRFD